MPSGVALLEQPLDRPGIAGILLSLGFILYPEHLSVSVFHDAMNGACHDPRLGGIADGLDPNPRGSGFCWSSLPSSLKKGRGRW